MLAAAMLAGSAGAAAAARGGAASRAEGSTSPMPGHPGAVIQPRAGTSTAYGTTELADRSDAARAGRGARQL